MVESEPSTLEKISGTLWDVGGNPGRIHGAADICRQMATNIDDRTETLQAVAKATLEGWRHGAGRDKYKATADKVMCAISEYSCAFNTIAGQLDEAADAIKHAQDQATKFKIAAGAAAAVGIGLAVFTGGLSLGESAAGVAAAEAGFWAMMASLAARLAAIGMQIFRATQAFRWGIAISGVSTVAAKSGHMFNPLQWGKGLNPDLYTADDATNIMLGGILTSGMVKLAGALKFRFPGLANAGLPTKITINSAAGFGGGATGTAINQYWVLGKHGWKPMKTVAVVGGLAAAFGGVNRGAAALMKSKTPPFAGGMTAGDKVRAMTGVPVGSVIYLKNFGKGKPKAVLQLAPLPKAPHRP